MQKETRARGVREPHQGHTGWSWVVAPARHVNPKAQLNSPQRVFREHAVPQVGLSGGQAGGRGFEPKFPGPGCSDPALSTVPGRSPETDSVFPATGGTRGQVHPFTSQLTSQGGRCPLRPRTAWLPWRGLGT